jgi:hypothetical protein
MKSLLILLALSTTLVAWPSNYSPVIKTGFWKVSIIAQTDTVFHFQFGTGGKTNNSDTIVFSSTTAAACTIMTYGTGILIQPFNKNKTWDTKILNSETGKMRQSFILPAGTDTFLLTKSQAANLPTDSTLWPDAFLSFTPLPTKTITQSQPKYCPIRSIQTASVTLAGRRISQKTRNQIQIINGKRVIEIR